MPSFDSNSRDRLDQDQREHLDEEDQNDRAQVKVPEFTSDTSSSKTETKTDNHPVTPTDDVSDDLEISDSDSSSGIKSREISDAEETSQEKTVKPEDKPKDEESSKDKSRVVDLEDTDDYLLYLEDILRTVHKAYYDLHDQSSSPKASLDLKMVIPYVRKKTLQGVTMVMSGVVPTQVILNFWTARGLLFPKIEFFLHRVIFEVGVFYKYGQLIFFMLVLITKFARKTILKALLSLATFLSQRFDLIA